MSISFIGSASATATNGGDATITLPGGLQQNDLVIVGYGIGDNDNVDFNMAMVTAGYTEVADLFADDVQDTNLGVYWKIMGATPDTTAVVDGQGGADASVCAVCMVFRGVDITTPMDVAPTTATGIDTGAANPPSINHNNPSGVWTVAIGAAGHVAGISLISMPTGYITDQTRQAADDTSDVSVSMGYNSAPSDPEDPGSLTTPGADTLNNSWCACTIALRPASTPAQVPRSFGFIFG